MSKQPITIPKKPELQASEDYFALRKEGIQNIEKMGSEKWTDYNTHDPGITILEALSYAITDLAFRAQWEIKDLLAESTDQAFFTAREILTVNPWTTDDYRRLLIDIDVVRNAWMICKECACETTKDNLVVRGLYDVLLELEASEDFGDLNDRKITATFYEEIANKLQPLTLELRFPDWQLTDQDAYTTFVESSSEPTNVVISKFSRSKTASNTIGNDELRKYWRNVFYATLSFDVDGTVYAVENIAMRFFGSTSVKNATTVDYLKDLIANTEADGFIQTYRGKRKQVALAVEESKSLLQDHRNLDEDFCDVRVIDIEDVAACADVEVAADADIERVQAEIWFAIEQYFNPTVKFYSLQEMLEDGTPVEDIFNGPELSNGFIKQDDLDAAQLKTVLRVSDIINLIMDIDGVVAVSNMMLTKYDSEGNVVKGASDPTWVNGLPMFDANKISASWLLYLTQQHLPRLYHILSNFHFSKNGLPFSARQDEAYDTLVELRGAAEKIKIKNAANDLEIPDGTVRNLDDVEPVQHGFPLVYGVGKFGLPSHASTLRRAQAHQLKAYLLVFEQILANNFAQVARVADLFALSPDVDRTYFYKLFSDSVINGYSELVTGLTEPVLAGLVETSVEFHDRRNIFLDHLMARFGEQFGEYALLLTNWQGDAVGNERLIEDKISFLKEYPSISHDRARAFNYSVDPVLPENYPGIKKRVSLLLGFPNLHFEWNVVGTGPFTIDAFELIDGNGKVWLDGTLSVSAPTLYEAKKLAYEAVLVPMSVPGAFDEELVAWASNERSIVVEHLLLRPKFPGDALFPPCGPEEETTDDCDCEDCSTDDPYSFRLTFVMPGWSAPYNENMDLRGFANRTIQYETPSHLLGKTCWVGNDGFVENVCDPVVDEISDLLQEQGLTSGGSRPTCLEAGECATVIYQKFSDEFKDWYEDKTLTFFESGALEASLKTLFDTINPADLSCTTDVVPLWSEIEAILIKHFHHIALYGWQFERFENAWHLWLDANSKFDWPNENLVEKVEAILIAGMLTGTAIELCECARSIVVSYGTSFYDWMEANIKSGTSFENLGEFTPPSITLCSSATFKANVQEDIQSLLDTSYTKYIEVSYRLWVVLNLLNNLRNTYPAATLHDCDDGSDINPVRLGSTALGNPLSSSSTLNETSN